MNSTFVINGLKERLESWVRETYWEESLKAIDQLEIEAQKKLSEKFHMIRLKTKKEIAAISIELLSEADFDGISIRIKP